MSRNGKMREWQARKDELTWDRKSIAYWNNEAADDPRLRAYREAFEGADRFISDVSSRIMPIGHSRGDSWKAVVSPSNAEAEALLIAALDHDGHAHSLEYALQGFIRECASSMLWSGEAVYEIVPVRERDSGHAVGFRLSFLQAGTLLRRRGQLVQYVPLAVAQEHGCDRYVPLSPQSIITFGLPFVSREKVRFRSMLGCLSWQNRHSMPRFWIESYDPATPPKKRVPFDATHHFRTQALAAADATKAIGYNAGAGIEKHSNEYYFCYRELKYQGFLIQVRDAILDTLNEGLERVEGLISADTGALGRIQLQGLPTLTDVKAAQKELYAGNVSLSAVLIPFRGW
jgi:hypothetical protein